MTADWRDINLANWESRVPVHTGPGGYDLTRFDDPDYLSPVVRYDLPRLGRLDHAYDVEAMPAEQLNRGNLLASQHPPLG